MRGLTLLSLLAVSLWACRRGEPPQSTALPPGQSPDTISALRLDSLLIQALDQAPELGGDTIPLRSPDDTLGSPFEGQPLGRQLELRLAGFFPSVTMDSGPSIYRIGRFSLSKEWVAYVVRVPGMYDPSRLELLVFKKDGSRLWRGIALAETWGDAGDTYRLRSWLARGGQDGVLQVIQHECLTHADVDDDAAPPVVADSIRVISWRDSAFTSAVLVKDRAVVRRFSSGPDACLPN